MLETLVYNKIHTVYLEHKAETLVFFFTLRIRDSSLKVNLSLLPSHTHSTGNSCVCENSGTWGREGLDRTQIHFTLPSHTHLGLNTIKHYSSLNPFSKHCRFSLISNRMSEIWMFNSSLSALTCRAITRKRDPCAGEMWPCDPRC